MDIERNRFKDNRKPGDTTINIEGSPRVKDQKRVSIVLVLGIVLLIALFFVMVISYTNRTPPHLPNSNYHIYMVADRDDFSKNKKTGSYESSLFHGTLSRSVGSDGKVSYKYVSEDKYVLTSPHIESEKGKTPRGVEISALSFWRNKLYTCCDRTGIVYEIRKKEDSENFVLLPRYILNVGNGNTDPKGFKCEWMTSKDGYLIVGSIGKEWTTRDGDFLNNDPMYVKYIHPSGKISSVSWVDKYNTVRKEIHPEVLSPGYAVQEAVVWNNENKKWYFLPRRVSKTLYDDKVEIEKGAFIMISLSEDGKEAEMIPINGKSTKYRGFSEVKSIPGFMDEMVALRTEEEYRTGKTKSYMVVVNVKGEILMEETYLEEDKLEGLEISDESFF